MSYLRGHLKMPFGGLLSLPLTSRLSGTQGTGGEARFAADRLLSRYAMQCLNVAITGAWSLFRAPCCTLPARPWLYGRLPHQPPCFDPDLFEGAVRHIPFLARRARSGPRRPRRPGLGLLGPARPATGRPPRPLAVARRGGRALGQAGGSCAQRRRQTPGMDVHRQSRLDPDLSYYDGKAGAGVVA